MRLLWTGSCKWKHFCTYSLHKCLLCTKSVGCSWNKILSCCPCFSPHLAEVCGTGSGSFVVCAFKKHFFQVHRSPWPARCCSLLGTCVILQNKRPWNVTVEKYLYSINAVYFLIFVYLCLKMIHLPWIWRKISGKLILDTNCHVQVFNNILKPILIFFHVSILQYKNALLVVVL